MNPVYRHMDDGQLHTCLPATSANVLEHAGVGLWEWHSGSDEMFFSCGLEQLLGYCSGELPRARQGWNGFLFPVDRELVEQSLQRCINDADGLYETEHRIRRKDGKAIWVRATGAVVERFADGSARVGGLLQDITRYRQAEPQPHGSEALLKMAAELVQLADWELDIPTRRVVFSENYHKMLGYFGARLDRNMAQWDELAHPDDAPRVSAALWDYIEGRTPCFSTEMRMRHRDGHYIWTMEIGTITEWGQDGNPTRMVGAHLNIDRLKRAEQNLHEALKLNRQYAKSLEGTVQTAVRELRESNEINYAIAEANPHVNLMFDEHLRLTDCNPAAVAYFGMSSKAELLRDYPKFLQGAAPPEWSLLIQQLHQVLESGYVEFETELPVRGTQTPMNIILKKVPTRDSFMILLYLYDLTSVRKAQEELQRRDVLLTAANLAASELMASDQESFERVMHNALRRLGKSVDADRIYVWQNYQSNGKLCCRQIYEWSECPSERSASDNPAEHEYIPFWWEELQKNQIISIPVRELPEAERRISEARGIVHLLFTPLFLRGEFWGFLGFDDCRNERHFSEMEQQLLLSGGMMIASALQRNAMTDSLIQAREEALESTRAKTSFLANMSHEMRTPLNAIIGMTTIAQSGDADIADCLEKIDGAAKLLLGIINDVLEMSKIEDQNLELHIEEFSFHTVMDTIYNIHSAAALEKSLAFEMKIDPQIPGTLYGDEVRISQAVGNLLSNAVKFTPEGGSVLLDAELLNEQNGWCQLEIAVQDTGIGIAQEHINRLFRAFEQADGSISRQYGGTGLGLTITKSIVEHMGGEVRVQSEPGRGSRFSVCLRLKEGTGECADSDNNEQGASGDYDFSGRNFLLAEDVEVNRLIVQQLLEPTGAAIDFAENGQAAWEMFRENPQRYDIIFMDIHMPLMDGYEATEHIRASTLPRAREIPIIAMTANTFPEDIERCLQSGMNAHIAKPIDYALLLTTIAGQLETSKKLHDWHSM